MSTNPKQMKDQQAREQKNLQRAKESGYPITYIDTDGCEVTVLPSGHVFYNAADWY